MGVFAGETFSYTDQQEMQAQATSCWGRGNILVNGHRRKKHGGFADHGGFKKPHRISTACGQTLMIHPGLSRHKLRFCEP